VEEYMKRSKSAARQCHYRQNLEKRKKKRTKSLSSHPISQTTLNFTSSFKTTTKYSSSTKSGFSMEDRCGEFLQNATIQNFDISAPGLPWLKISVEETTKEILKTGSKHSKIL
jgi:hypothetical protein